MRTSRSDSQLTGTLDRKLSTCSTLDHEPFGEIFVGLVALDLSRRAHQSTSIEDGSQHTH